jgi:hypothetical protein
MGEEMRKTHKEFRKALRIWDAGTLQCRADTPPRRALFACWWFIENVRGDDPAVDDIFFELRDMVRAAR